LLHPGSRIPRRTLREIRMRALLMALLLAATAGTALAQGAPRGPDGFRNNYPHPEKGSFWQWQWERLRNGVPRSPPGGWNIPAARTDPVALRAPENNPSVTWIGHATVLVRIGGSNVLFDPVFSERASPLPFSGPGRVVPLPLDIGDLPRIDLVLITHNHYDHLDEASVRRLAAMPQGSPRFLVPLGLKAWFEELGITRVDEFDWWEQTREGPLALTFVPAQHWSRRSLNDTNQTLWGGWVLEGEGMKLIHTGDTGYSKDFRDIGERLGPFDLAFIPIGAYAPRWFMQTIHVVVPEAVHFRVDLRAARAIGIHWGTFESLTDEPLDEPPQLLAQQRELRGLTRDQFDVMTIGEIRPLQR
jgi:L-ascorbate metabolism protein UlaG (beta-lactamase superfamily)